MELHVCRKLACIVTEAYCSDRRTMLQGGNLVIKAGYNEWEDIRLHNLQQANELKDLDNSDWLVVETKLPEVCAGPCQDIPTSDGVYQ